MRWNNTTCSRLAFDSRAPALGVAAVYESVSVCRDEAKGSRKLSTGRDLADDLAIDTDGLVVLCSFVIVLVCLDVSLHVASFRRGKRTVHVHMIALIRGNGVTRLLGA